MSKVAIAIIVGLGCLFLVVAGAVVVAILFFFPLRAEPESVERPETAGPRAEVPPPAVLVIDGQEQVSGVGTYCWTDPAGDRESVAVCVDMIGIPTDEEPVTVNSPFAGRLELPLEESPDELVMEVLSVTDADEIESHNNLRWWEPQAGERHDLPLANDSEFRLSLDPGQYVLSVFARWSGRGDVNYGFLVLVDR